MTGYEMPLRAIREQIASAVDLIVHTARLKDGSRKIVNITEVYGIEDDEILTQDIFAFEQTGVQDGKIQGELKPTGIRPTFMGQFKRSGHRRCRRASSASRPRRTPGRCRGASSRNAGAAARAGERDVVRDPASVTAVRSRPAGWSTCPRSDRSIPTTGQAVPGGIKDQARRCLSNLKATLEEQGSSLDKIVWANWSLQRPRPSSTPSTRNG